jgi:hypothetical protein
VHHLEELKDVGGNVLAYQVLHETIIVVPVQYANEGKVLGERLDDRSSGLKFLDRRERPGGLLVPGETE